VIFIASLSATKNDVKLSFKKLAKELDHVSLLFSTGICGTVQRFTGYRHRNISMV
jgi:hypothetical protein